MTFDLQAEVKRADEQWKLAHGMKTFADLPIGARFKDFEHGPDMWVYEKTSGKFAIRVHSLFGDYEFAPDDRVEEVS